MIRYTIPTNWIRYDPVAIAQVLVDAKAIIISLQNIPYQKQWVERLQEIELKREVAGTSRIEGADFTEQELDLALHGTAEQLATRSQRQAHAAVKTYRWIATLQDDRPTDSELVREIHRGIVIGADDDHCPPGELRKTDQNVNFGAPRHRGAEGGEEVRKAFDEFIRALRQEFRGHDPVIQALAAHYHFAAMHPFLDGNGRTARALEALMLQRAGLRNTAFIAMSNYYYDEKPAYLTALAAARAAQHDLTPFLLFALRGVAIQGGRMLAEVRREMQKEVFRNLMYRLFTRLPSPRKRVIGERQVEMLKVLLEETKVTWGELRARTTPEYLNLKNRGTAAARDVINLESLGAVSISRDANGDVQRNESGEIEIEIRLDWPTEIDESGFLERYRNLPQANTHRFLRDLE